MGDRYSLMFAAMYAHRFQFIIASMLLVFLMSWGCRKKAPVVVPLPAPTETNPPSTPPTTPPEIQPAPHKLPPEPISPQPTPLPIVVPDPSGLDLGEMNFQLGDYAKAAQFFEDYLKANPNLRDRDKALFHMGLSYALSGNSSKNRLQAEAALKRLITEFPNSQYKSQAEFILMLQAQIEALKSDVKKREMRIKQLSEELQKLKEIDMQRRPSRPPE